jgi:diguanylate cyclase
VRGSACGWHSRLPRLTLRVLEQDLADARRWRAAGHSIQVALHISAPNLLDPSFAEGVAARLRAAGIGADALTLEVTEQTLRGHPVRGLAALARLRAVGVELALRDFRGDQFLLARLARLPVRELKLAPDVVAGVVGGADDRAIVAAIIALAKGLDMRVGADGSATPRRGRCSQGWAAIASRARISRARSRPRRSTGGSPMKPACTARGRSAPVLAPSRWASCAAGRRRPTRPRTDAHPPSRIAPRRVAYDDRASDPFPHRGPGAP